MPTARGVKPAASAGQLRREQTTVKTEWHVVVEVDEVLQAEGGDPERIRARNSSALAVAERALELSGQLLHPAVAWRFVPVVGLRHASLLLEGACRLTGPVVVEHLQAAKQVGAFVCTLGPELEEHASAFFDEDPALAVALDAIGSVALQRLAHSVREQIALQMGSTGWQVGMALSPGSAWGLEIGQRQLFALVEAELIGVGLNKSSLMQPKKSTSFILGVGPDMTSTGSPCDLCDLKENCRFRELYESEHDRDVLA